MNNKSFLKLGSSGALYFTPEKIKYGFRQRNQKIPTKKMIKDFLEKNESWQLHRKSPKKIKNRNPYFTDTVNQQLSVDLIDFSSYSRYNQQRKYILLAIDIFSRKLFGRCLVTKTAGEVKKKLKEILLEIEKYYRPYPWVF